MDLFSLLYLVGVHGIAPSSSELFKPNDDGLAMMAPEIDQAASIVGDLLSEMPGTGSVHCDTTRLNAWPLSG
jgi:hypothetical protein